MKTHRYLLVCLLCLCFWGLPLASWSAPPQAAQKSQVTPLRPVNINTASAQELQLIPGIGGTLAERIIQYRSENGPFKDAESLTAVRGIGDKSFAKLRPWIVTK